MAQHALDSVDGHNRFPVCMIHTIREWIRITITMMSSSRVRSFVSSLWILADKFPVFALPAACHGGQTVSVYRSLTTEKTSLALSIDYPYQSRCWQKSISSMKELVAPLLGGEKCADSQTWPEYYRPCHCLDSKKKVAKIPDCDVERINKRGFQIDSWARLPAAGQLLQGMTKSISHDEVVRLMQLELLQHGSLVTSFVVCSDFQSYFEQDPQKVYRHQSGHPIGVHSVVIVGWGRTDLNNGHSIPYWLVRNSWGTNWGDRGYFRFLRGENHCEIEGSVIYPVLTTSMTDAVKDSLAQQHPAVISPSQLKLTFGETVTVRSVSAGTVRFDVPVHCAVPCFLSHVDLKIDRKTDERPPDAPAASTEIRPDLTDASEKRWILTVTSTPASAGEWGSIQMTAQDKLRSFSITQHYSMPMLDFDEHSLALLAPSNNNRPADSCGAFQLNEPINIRGTLLDWITPRRMLDRGTRGGLKRKSTFCVSSHTASQVW